MSSARFCFDISVAYCGPCDHLFVHVAEADSAARSDWRRGTALSGIGFVVCFAIAAGLYGGGAGSQQREISAYYADAGSRIHQIEGVAVLLAGCVILLVYVAVLQRLVADGSWMRQLAAMSGTGAVDRRVTPAAGGCRVRVSDHIDGGSDPLGSRDLDVGSAKWCDATVVCGARDYRERWAGIRLLVCTPLRILLVGRGGKHSPAPKVCV